MYIPILWSNPHIMMDSQPLTRLTTACCINEELPEGSKSWPFGDSDPTHLSLPKRYMWRPGFCGNKRYELHLFWITCSSRNLIILTPLFNPGPKYLIAQWFYAEIVDWTHLYVCEFDWGRAFPFPESRAGSSHIARSCSFPLPPSIQFLHYDLCHIYPSCRGMNDLFPAPLGLLIWFQHWPLKMDCLPVGYYDQDF